MTRDVRSRRALLHAAGVGLLSATLPQLVHVRFHRPALHVALLFAAFDGDGLRYAVEVVNPSDRAVRGARISFSAVDSRGVVKQTSSSELLPLAKPNASFLYASRTVLEKGDAVSADLNLESTGSFMADDAGDVLALDSYEFRDVSACFGPEMIGGSLVPAGCYTGSFAVMVLEVLRETRLVLPACSASFIFRDERDRILDARGGGISHGDVRARPVGTRLEGRVSLGSLPQSYAAVDVFLHRAT